MASKKSHAKEPAADETAKADRLAQAGDLEGAERLLGKVIRRSPGFAPAHNVLGMVHFRAGRFDQAIAAFRQAIDRDAGMAQAHYNLGIALVNAKIPDEAEACHRRALAIEPAFHHARRALGTVLYEAGRIDEAEREFRALVDAAAPGISTDSISLGGTLRALNRLDEAEAILRRAAEAFPDNVDCLNNLGVVLTAGRKPDQAEIVLRRVLALRPDDDRIKWNMSLALLLAGKYEDAFQFYESRWTGCPSIRPSRIMSMLPMWDGRRLDDEALLIHAEQGMGDTLHFIRYLPLVGQRVKRLIVHVQRPLVRLIRAMPGVDFEVVAEGDPVPAVAWQCPLLSLPRIFGTTLDTIPAQVPYLAAPPSRDWAAALGRRPKGGLRVGLVWAGDSRKNLAQVSIVDGRRSITLDQLAPLARVANVQFVSLQKGEPAIQAKNPPPGMEILDVMDQVEDFGDTAALMGEIDLVVTVDTSVAHLAGALGKPCWVLSRYDGCWRWLLDRSDSPWYPTVRLFRQKQPGRWIDPIHELAEALEQLAAGKGPRRRAVPDVSVIVPVFNAADRLGDTVRSALGRAGGREVEVVIVDDGSTDDSLRVANALAARHPSVVVVRQERRLGPGAARNAGAHHARGRHIAFLDAGDVYEEGWLDTAIGLLDQHPDFACVRGGLVLDGAPPLSDAQREAVVAASANNLLVRRPVFDLVGGFTEELRDHGGEDVIFQYMVARWFRLFGVSSACCRCSWREPPLRELRGLRIAAQARMVAAFEARLQAVDCMRDAPLADVDLFT